ncbi:hypothetical protein P167DRAFT_545573 [Morchella conica CCBAS932]|uniref:Uncharacterized protein n=1 Tax=Morchella conica CCBAS932 TaxID=1392247 RepID=A0A3N4KPA5_9PEZI|nr:hypothetical protein P167DRAFT_545573 [Morchella conica CCBAS932]
MSTAGSGVRHTSAQWRAVMCLEPPIGFSNSLIVLTALASKLNVIGTGSRKDYIENWAHHKPQHAHLKSSENKVTIYYEILGIEKSHHNCAHENLYVNLDWLTVAQLDDIVLSLGALLDDLLAHQLPQGHSEAAQARYRNVRSTAQRWQKTRHDLAKADVRKARNKEWRRFNAQGRIKLVVQSILLDGSLRVIFIEVFDRDLKKAKLWEGGSSLCDLKYP